MATEEKTALTGAYCYRTSVVVRGMCWIYTSRLLLRFGYVFESEVGGSCILFCLLLLCYAVGAGEASVGLSGFEESSCESGGDA